ncbi:hypothetical protein PUN28_010470 [Cardiocondyla obscurior]|uniref:Uncharacterized protein n=1 Tax=Cardiocondyla obscurior TaxID=286306 RepID=A0AAW2FL98_9HYME
MITSYALKCIHITKVGDINNKIIASFIKELKCMANTCQKTQIIQKSPATSLNVYITSVTYPAIGRIFVDGEPTYEMEIKNMLRLQIPHTQPFDRP